MRKVLVLGAMALAFLLSSPALLADPITYTPGAASPAPEISLLSVSASNTPYVGRGAEQVGSSRWVADASQFASGSTLQSILTEHGVKEVVAFRSSFSLSQGLSSLSAEQKQGAMTFTGAGRLPFQQLLLLPGNAQVATTQTRVGTRNIPVLANPEPASLLLLGTGIAAIGFGRRRRPTAD